MSIQFINTFRVPYNLFEKEDFIKLRPTVKVVLFYLLRCRDKYNKETFYATTTEICKATGLARETVLKAKRILVEKKFIGIVMKNQTDHHIYFKFGKRVPNHFNLDFLFESKVV